MRFRVEDRVFETLPEVCFGVIIAKGIDNTRNYPQIEQMLELSVAAAEERFRGAKVKEDPAIIPYREAFLKLGINPNKFMCSIESLFTRISKGKGVPHINPVVDLLNAVSIKYQLPMGSHDIDQMDADIEERFSRKTDTFLPFGETQREEMPEGELVYAVGSEIRTRRWIWRQSEIGKMGEGSRNIFFPIDGFKSVNGERISVAQEELMRLCESMFHCEARIAFVDREHPEVEL